jgi:hypothetical protein
MPATPQRIWQAIRDADRHHPAGPMTFDARIERHKSRRAD